MNSKADRRRQRYYYPYPAYAALARLARPLRFIRPRLPILLYHSVCDDMSVPYADHFNVRPETFAKQMAWLRAQGYQAVTPAQLLHSATPNHRQVLITFDDGYHNNIEKALPILQQNDLHAVFFIAPGFLDQQDAFPWIKTTNPESNAAYRPMTTDQVRQLHDLGMTIGAHTRTHRRLTELSDEEARREILESCRRLGAIIREPIHTFAFPYGSRHDYNTTHLDFCRKAGLQSVFTTRPCTLGNYFQSLELPRLTIIERDQVQNFASKIYGLFDAFEPFRHYSLMPWRLFDRLR
jgi:peptidoglycan/xylan/chitin deacetylase (PgdA/CDA1 family)